MVYKPSKQIGGRLGKSDLEWTADKLLKGAGAGADPIEIDVPASHVELHIRALTDAAGDVAYTGYGFKPTSLRIFACKLNSAEASWGFCDSALNSKGLFIGYDGLYTTTGTRIIYILTGSAEYQQASVKSFDADGFTLTWTKSGSPTGDCYFVVLAIR